MLDRLVEVRLLDDAAFAEQWVDSRHRHRGLGRRALSQELRRKGVESETADEAVAGLDADAEREKARELVRRRLPSLDRVEPQAAARRLVGMLARKGYGAGLAYEVVRTEMAQRGAELDEADPDLEDSEPARRATLLTSEDAADACAVTGITATIVCDPDDSPRPTVVMCLAPRGSAPRGHQPRRGHHHDRVGPRPGPRGRRAGSVDEDRCIDHHRARPRRQPPDRHGARRHPGTDPAARSLVAPSADQRAGTGDLRRLRDDPVVLGLGVLRGPVPLPVAVLLTVLLGELRPGLEPLRDLPAGVPGVDPAGDHLAAVPARLPDHLLLLPEVVLPGVLGVAAGVRGVRAAHHVLR